MFRAGLACFTDILVLGNCRDPCLWMLCWDKHAWDKQLKGCFGKGTCFLPSFAKSTTECRSAEQIPLPGMPRAPRQPQTLLSFQPTAVPNTGVLASESHNSSATGAIWRLGSSWAVFIAVLLLHRVSLQASCVSAGAEPWPRGLRVCRVPGRAGQEEEGEMWDGGLMSWRGKNSAGVSREGQ